MAYTTGYNRSYRNNNYNQFSGWRDGNNYSNRKVKKRSGAKLRKSRDGQKFLVQAWNVSKRKGFITLSATILDEIVKSKRNEYTKAVCNVTYLNSGQRLTLGGFWNEQTKKLYIPNLQMVASVNAPNGGYFGSVKVKR